MGLRVRGASVLLGFALCVACGGRAEEAAPLRPSVNAQAGSGSSGAPSFGGSSGASSSAGAVTGTAGQPVSGGQSGAPVGGASNLIALGCPDPATNAACPAVTADLDFRSTTDNQSSSWVEPLQVPQFGSRPPNYYPPDPGVDPALWDRSALPAGACVFRLHGMPGSCIRPGYIFEGTCTRLDDGGLAPSPGEPSPGDFYENNTCAQGIAPGCPSSNPWGYDGFWWYMVPRGADTDLVVCAPECAQAFQANGQTCLTIHSAD
jgi:hypothetical protein